MPFGRPAAGRPSQWCRRLDTCPVRTPRLGPDSISTGSRRRRDRFEGSARHPRPRGAPRRDGGAGLRPQADPASGAHPRRVGIHELRVADAGVVLGVRADSPEAKEASCRRLPTGGARRSTISPTSCGLGARTRTGRTIGETGACGRQAWLWVDLGGGELHLDADTNRRRVEGPGGGVPPACRPERGRPAMARRPEPRRPDRSSSAPGLRRGGRARPRARGGPGRGQHGESSR